MHCRLRLRSCDETWARATLVEIPFDHCHKLICGLKLCSLKLVSRWKYVIAEMSFDQTRHKAVQSPAARSHKL